VLHIPLILASALVGTAEAGSGRLSLGLNTATGFSPAEPSWRDGQWSTAAAVGCGGLTGWWITGGHEYAGPRGEVLRTPDEVRWGAVAKACPTTGGGAVGAAGVGYGRQWGGAMYASTQMVAGVATFVKEGPNDWHYAAFAPYLEPKLAFGVGLPPGVSIEVGPYAMITPPLLRSIRGELPHGTYLGHVGVELTLLAGAASPQAPWRR
jgi:hypothetical protein